MNCLYLKGPQFECLNLEILHGFQEYLAEKYFCYASAIAIIHTNLPMQWSFLIIVTIFLRTLTRVPIEPAKVTPSSDHKLLAFMAFDGYHKADGVLSVNLQNVFDSFSQIVFFFMGKVEIKAKGWLSLT